MVELERWYDDPALDGVWGDPLRYLSDLAARNDALAEEREELVEIDPVAMDAYLAGTDRDVDVTTEAA